MNVNSCSYIYSEAERFRQKLWNDLNNVNFSDAFVELDNICDYIPGISIISNLVDLFQKYAIHPFFPGEVKDRYWSHIEQKDPFRSLLLLLPYPVLPQYAVASFDLAKKADQRMVNRNLKHLQNETLHALNEVDNYLLKFLPKQKKETNELLYKISEMESELDVLFPEENAITNEIDLADTLLGEILNDGLDLLVVGADTPEALKNLSNKKTLFSIGTPRKAPTTPKTSITTKWMSPDKKALFSGGTSSKSSSTPKTPTITERLTADQEALFGSNSSNTLAIPETEKIDVIFKRLLSTLKIRLSEHKKDLIEEENDDVLDTKNNLNEIENNTNESVNINTKNGLKRKPIKAHASRVLESLNFTTSRLEKNKEINEFNLFNLATSVSNTFEFFLELKEQRQKE